MRILFATLFLLASTTFPLHAQQLESKTIISCSCKERGDHSMPSTNAGTVTKTGHCTSNDKDRK